MISPLVEVAGWMIIVLLLTLARLLGHPSRRRSSPEFLRSISTSKPVPTSSWLREIVEIQEKITREQGDILTEALRAKLDETRYIVQIPPTGGTAVTPPQTQTVKDLQEEIERTGRENRDRLRQISEQLRRLEQTEDPFHEYRPRSTGNRGTL